jgi:hypothetical protein
LTKIDTNIFTVKDDWTKLVHPKLTNKITIDVLEASAYYNIINKTAYIGFGGTDTIDQVLVDINIITCNIYKDNNGMLYKNTELTDKVFDNINNKVLKIHSGFWDYFEKYLNNNNNTDEFETGLIDLIFNKLPTDDIDNIILTGHSLGGALATICCLFMMHDVRFEKFKNKSIQLITFASPATGNSVLSDLIVKIKYGELNLKTMPQTNSLRIVTDCDIIPCIISLFDLSFGTNTLYQHVEYKCLLKKRNHRYILYKYIFYSIFDLENIYYIMIDIFDRLNLWNIINNHLGAPYYNSLTKN